MNTTVNLHLHEEKTEESEQKVNARMVTLMIGQTAKPTRRVIRLPS